MEPIAALHTAARRYCISIVPWLDPRAREVEYNNPDTEPEESGPDGALSREEYWRQELLPGILQEIERKTPEDFTSLAELRTFLVTVGREAAYGPRDNLLSPVIATWSSAPQPEGEDLAVMAAGRERFCAYIERLSLDDLLAVPPLPHRRTLSDREAEAIFENLRARWPSPLLWFVALGDTFEYRHMEGVLRFWWFRFAEHVPLDRLRATLKEASVDRVWQVGDVDEPAYEVVTDAFVPQGEEAHFTSEGLDWVIYCDHDGRIALSGDPLVDMVRDMWADWARYEDEGYVEV
jgi:hypothetical protein